MGERRTRGARPGSWSRAARVGELPPSRTRLRQGACLTNVRLLRASLATAPISQTGSWTIVWVVKRLFRFTLAAGFWTAVALVFALPGLSDRPDWGVLLASLAHWWSWGALAPAITAIDDRLPVSTQHRLATHLGIGVACVVVYAYLAAYVAALLGAGAWPN